MQYNFVRCSFILMPFEISGMVRMACPSLMNLYVKNIGNGYTCLQAILVIIYFLTVIIKIIFYHYCEE